ncbi:transcription factor bHLH35 isoform X2 [Beta vulgaris subsp. vulgaris]|uniref:transcription factor bHLH35 isoform X2 n=1 Tax=Beta vulgaris subsp. vulgaris TaxID=3555 RepID=UPI000901B253|nr:transcription factor bHLH35 isoform X2 [Beta vulgaris subsp. vulgaris]
MRRQFEHCRRKMSPEEAQRPPSGSSSCCSQHYQGSNFQMDKASTIKDAISYIHELQEQERRIKEDIANFDRRRCNNNGDNNSTSSTIDFEQEFSFLSNKNSTDHDRQQYDFNNCCRSSIIDDLKITVSYVGGRIVIVSLSCVNKKGILVKLCEMLESLKLKVTTAHITVVGPKILKTVYVEADEQEKDHLRKKIEMAISSLRM